MKTKLMPEHLEDLRRSGLKDKTIQAAGIYTSRPQELAGISGWKGTGLVFPYFGIDNYFRVKLFPPKESNGHKQKYWCRPGTGNHLYIPPGVEEKTKDTSIPIYITEGEKKSLAAVQAGMNCIAVPGLWNWSNGQKELIDDFQKITWQGRTVYLVPDNDYKNADRKGHRKNLVQAVRRLGHHLIDGGARVHLVLLPKGQAKGLDDYLLKNTVADFAKLPTEEIRKLSLDEAIEQATFDDLKGLLIRIASVTLESEREGYIGKLSDKLKIKRSALAKDIKAIISEKTGSSKSLDAIEEADIIHTSVDFREDTVFLGFRVTGVEGDHLLTIVAGPEGITVSIDAEELAHDDGALKLNKKTTAPYIKDTWSMDGLKKFKADPRPPQGLFQKIKDTLQVYLDLPDPRAYSLTAAWAVGTYFAWGFAAYPYLHYFGPKETGKSKTLEALRCLCSGAWKGRDLTVAALGDTVEGLRGTILLDQAERLIDAMIGLLADGYKRAGGKRRVVEITAAGRHVQEFSTYGPKAFASTKDLDPDLRDRCIRVSMVRTSKSLPDLEGWEPCWSEIRDGLFRFLLTSWPRVQAAYSRMAGDGTRSTELWRPIQAVMEALGVEVSEIEETKMFFLGATEGTRHELSPWEEALFDALLQVAGDGFIEFKMTPEKIITAMAIDAEKGPGPRWVGGCLSQFSLYLEKQRPKEGRTRQTVYTFDPEHVRNMAKKYFRDTPLNDVSLSPHDESLNDDDGLSGAQEKRGTRHNVSKDGNGDGGDTSGRVPKDGVCTTKPFEFKEDSDEGTLGHVNPGGIQEKVFEDVIDLTGVEFEVLP